MDRAKRKEILDRYEKTEKSELTMRDMMPKQLKDCYMGRKPGKAQRIRQYFSKFTDRVRPTPGNELYDDLYRIKLYLDLHIIQHESKGDALDSLPAMLYHAEAPEILLEMLRHALKKEFFSGDSKSRCLPSMAISVLTSLHHTKVQSFLLVSDKIFRDSESVILEVTEAAFKDRYVWFDKLHLVQFYGVASCSRGCLWFLHRHMGVVRRLLFFVHHSRTLVDAKIERGEIGWQDEDLSQFLGMFQYAEDLELSARMYASYVTNHVVTFFWNLTNSARYKIDLFKAISKEITGSEVLDHFMHVARILMTWFNAGLFLAQFLDAITRCLKIAGAMESLFLKDLDHAIEMKRPLDIETFHFWNHETRKPNAIAWLFLHAFTMNSKMGYKQCVRILCYLVDKAEEEVANKVVDKFGLDLMDLAHFLEINDPCKLSVQSVILQALLRCGRIHHKVFGRSDIYEGDFVPSEKIQEFVLEAMLFCKKAQCESSMSEEQRHELATQADKVKEQGNEYFKSENYKDAIIKYTDAIALCPLSARKKQAIYYSNRAECHLRCKNYKKAIHDCNRSLCLDTAARLKVQWRRSKAYQALDLDYPAWLDMHCLVKDCTVQQVSGVDVPYLHENFSKKVGVLSTAGLSSVEQKLFNSFHCSVLVESGGVPVKC